MWRWHFYAGLLVLPFLVSLAITGGLYLFRDELDAIIHADLKRVELAAGARPIAPSAMVAAALAAEPGRADPGAAAEITAATPDKGKAAGYVDPYDGHVLGTLSDRGTVMWTIRTLHSLKYFGSTARALIEIAGGWAILLVGTGLYLWWPRARKGGQRGGLVTIRGTTRNRLFWRDTHAVTGRFVGGFIVFLAITGMPWSGVWGAKVNEWANGSNFGYPSGVRVDVPMSTLKLAGTGQTTWSLEQAELPQSASAATGWSVIAPSAAAP